MLITEEGKLITQELFVTINGNAVAPTLSAGSVDGNNAWESYRYPIGNVVNDVKNVKITSAGTIQANLLGADTNAGFGGYFSGFGTTPIVTISLSTPYPQACIGQSVLSVPGSLGTYQWYKDGVLISGATNNIYPLPLSDTSPAEYSTIITTPGAARLVQILLKAALALVRSLAQLVVLILVPNSEFL